MGITFSTPGKTSSGIEERTVSSPIAPIIVLSFPFEIWTARPAAFIFSITWSISFLVASFFITIIMPFSFWFRREDTPKHQNYAVLLFLTVSDNRHLMA